MEGGKPVADEGNAVAVHYEGKLDNGEVFDSSREREPLNFTVGSGQVIAGFDEAVRGMTVGETKEFRLEPDDAYGERREDLILEVPAAQAPDGLSAGDQVQLSNGAPATVVSIDDGNVRIDANHPLAGQALTFEIELVEVQ
ncbi:MAG: peptidylprolyl isomerase [Dehalococcoidia bacterium]|nr:peptidylprolyl isomerase [Dehalococcoidia bacterium]